eukprot:gene5319-10632_t
MLAIIIPCFGGFLHGYMSTLTWLQPHNSEYLLSFPVKDKSEYSEHLWLLFMLGECMGALSSCYLVDNIGRRTTLLLFCTLFTSATVCSLLTHNISTEVGLRWFSGICIGNLLVASSCYLAEISIHYKRGRNLAIFSLFTLIGQAAANIAFNYETEYLYDTLIGWRFSTIASAVVSATMVMGVLILPESPRWLSVHSTRTEVLRSLRSLRSAKEYKTEFTQINFCTSSVIDHGMPCTWITLLTDASLQYRIVLTCIIHISSQMAGIHVITAYGIVVLTRLQAHNRMIGFVLASTSGILGVIAGYHIVDYFGRRFLLMFGCGAVCLSWLGAATCAHIGRLEEGISDIDASSLRLRFLFEGFLCLFSFSYCGSIGIVSWVLPCEIFPVQCRAKAMALVTAVYCASLILASHSLMFWLGIRAHIAPGMIIFVLSAAVLGVVSFYLQPETSAFHLDCMGKLFSHHQRPEGGSDLWFLTSESFEKKNSMRKNFDSDSSCAQSEIGTEMPLADEADPLIA